jgi:hypothetical protein
LIRSVRRSSDVEARRVMAGYPVLRTRGETNSKGSEDEGGWLQALRAQERQQGSSFAIRRESTDARRDPREGQQRADKEAAEGNETEGEEEEEEKGRWQQRVKGI